MWSRFGGRARQEALQGETRLEQDAGWRAQCWERKGDEAGGHNSLALGVPQELGFYGECHGKSLECCSGECCGLIYSSEVSAAVWSVV